jgi:hypothetical protein
MDISCPYSHSDKCSPKLHSPVASIYTTLSGGQKFYILPTPGTYVFRLSEQTEIFFPLHSIKCDELITKKNCVHCAVRTEYLNIV